MNAVSNFPKQIKKRDGRIVDFDIARINAAIFKAMEASGQPNRKAAKELSEQIVRKLCKKHKKTPKFIPAIEEIQDLIEEILIENGYAKVAKNYILYRQKRTEIRAEKQKILNKEEIDDVDTKRERLLNRRGSFLKEWPCMPLCPLFCTIARLPFPSRKFQARKSKKKKKSAKMKRLGLKKNFLSENTN